MVRWLVNNEVEKMWKETAVAWHFPGGTEDNYEKFQSGS
jgi:hypothetical protein